MHEGIDLIETLMDRCLAVRESLAVITSNEATTYGELVDTVAVWSARLAKMGVTNGDVVLLKGSFSRQSITALIALLKIEAIIILLAPNGYEKEAEFSTVGEAQWIIESETGNISDRGIKSEHSLYRTLHESNEPGIILFSSGSTGTSKATVHSAARLLKKFSAPGKNLRTLAFLLFDHIAGIDTLFYSLFNQSTLVLPQDRSPHAVCGLIAAHKVEVLPTAPSFLNLMLISRAYENHDLSSLKIITYGSEMMPTSTLERCAEAFPNVRLIQKYGTSEIGALPTQSKSNTSTWLKLGGEGFEWRVQDGKFEVKAKTAMLGYLNAPSPFTEDGFFMTGDRVEVDGEYVRFLGRDSDIINVGGQKVFPAEVENLIRALPQVSEVSVYGEPHAILGAAVVAKIRPIDPEINIIDMRKTVRLALAGEIEPFKVPQKYLLTQDSLTTDRGKKIRKADN